MLPDGAAHEMAPAGPAQGDDDVEDSMVVAAMVPWAQAAPSPRLLASVQQARSKHWQHGMRSTHQARHVTPQLPLPRPLVLAAVRDTAATLWCH